MNAPDPSHDPNRILDQDERSPRPETIDVSQEVSTDTTAPFVPSPPAGVPTIPGYRITREIAKGGMGCVYAGHDLTLEREVAIKTLLPGANAERFVTEAKITAKLPHPNIPPVYALGTLDDGTPWLAMKLIRGQTLAKLLANRERERPQLVQIFEQISQAVGFAHAQGVIHRDLKPLNVMVGAFGEVQVMDWGLAKDLHRVDQASPGRESGESADVDHTAAGTIMGTPGYMAPEQARGEVVDARADVFALGSILAAMLTGKPAFVGTSKLETIQKSAAADLADVMGRLERCGADAELVAIAKRCLAANREERPADGRIVAEQVAAYRAGVEARLRQAETEAAQAVVRAEEQRKRRRQFNLAVAVIGLVLLAGLSASLWQMVRANAAERQAVANARQAELNAQQAEAERERAVKAAELEKAARLDEERERKFAQAISAFVKEDFLALTSVEGQGRFGGEGLDRNATLLDLLNRAAEKLKTRKGLDPRIEAELCWIVGVNYRGAGKAAEGLPFLERAVELRRRVFGVDHEETLIAINSLALGYREAGEFERALPLYEETVKLMKAKLGPDHPYTLGTMNNLASGYQAAGKLDLALPLYEETVKLIKGKLGPDHPHTLASMNNLASAYDDAGQLDRALPLYEETLKLRKAKLGPDHPHTLTSMNSLANGYFAAGQLAQALPLYEETLKLRKAKLGPDHPDTLASMNNLAEGYQAAGKLGLALPLYEETLKLRKAKLGPDHPQTLASMNNLALAYKDAGRLDLALPLYEETLKLRKAKLGPDHPDTLNSMNNLALAYKAADKPDLALPLLEETLKLRKAKLGPDHPDTLTSMNNLAGAYQAADKLDLALPLFQEAAAGMEKRQFQHEYAGRIVNNLINCHERLGQFDQAEVWRRKWLAVVKERAGADSPAYAGELAALGLNLLQQKKWADAEAVLRECLAIREKQEPDAWTTFNTMSLLGGALLGQKKYAQAEPLLVKGYEGMKAREQTIPPQGKDRLPEALDRLIELSTALEKPDEVKKYQELRAQYPPAKEQK